MTATYPPDRHLLRDLRLEFDHSDEVTSRAWLPVVPELCADDGSVRAGVLATLVDVIGGGFAATAAQPDWIATADLTLHVVGATTSGTVAATARVVHAGRTTVVIEVELRDDADREVGLATMSFARLPRRLDNPDIRASTSAGPSTMALATSRLDTSLLEMLGARVVDAARGELEVPVAEWSLNSLGAMQGGAVATVIDAAAEAASRAATSEPLVVTDLQITYLALGRVGPIRTRVDVLGTGPGYAASAGGVVDAGAEVAPDERRPGRRDQIPAIRAVNDIGEPAGRGIARFIGIDLREIEGTDEVAVRGRAPAAADLRGPHGGVRAGALLTMLDSVGGLCGGLAALPDGWVVSTNLSARTVAVTHTGPLRIDSRVLRQGRTSVLTAVQIHDEGAHDVLVLDGVLTSAILVPENGPPQWSRPLVLEAGAPAAESILDLSEWLGSKPVDESTIELELAEALRNPWGILHGGIVASLIDLAAEHVTGGITADVVLHFLAPNRVGPVRAEARPIGTRADGTVLRVEVRDHGADRVTALAVVTARKAE